MRRNDQTDSHHLLLYAENIIQITSLKRIMGSTSQTQLQSQENKMKSGLMLILSCSLLVFLELVVNGFIVSAH